MDSTEMSQIEEAIRVCRLIAFALNSLKSIHVVLIKNLRQSNLFFMRILATGLEPKQHRWMEAVEPAGLLAGMNLFGGDQPCKAFCLSREKVLKGSSRGCCFRLDFARILSLAFSKSHGALCLFSPKLTVWLQAQARPA